MDALTSLTWREPRYLWLLAAALLFALWLFQRERLRRSRAQRFVSERLRGNSNRIRVVRPFFAALALALAVIALAGPQAGAVTVPIETTQANHVFALDISTSMEARDVGSSRFDAAKSLLRQLLSTVNGRVALVVFERDAEVASPLTTDATAVSSLIETLGTAETAHAGSDLGGAIFRAIAAADIAPNQPLDFVLISDGEEQGIRLEEALRAAKKRGARVHTITIGSNAGSVIPTPAGPLRDERGEAVITVAHPEVMKRIAEATGGEAFENPFDTGAIARIKATLANSGGSLVAREMRIPIERFEFPLAAALALFLLAGFVHRGAE
jgi:Ca-activated chloride channel family protein